MRNGYFRSFSECEPGIFVVLKRKETDIRVKMDGKRVKQIEHPSIFVHQGTIPAFLLKLRNLLDDADCDHLIAWDPVSLLFILFYLLF